MRDGKGILNGLPPTPGSKDLERDDARHRAMSPSAMSVATTQRRAHSDCRTRRPRDPGSNPAGPCTTAPHEPQQGARPGKPTPWLAQHWARVFSWQRKIDAPQVRALPATWSLCERCHRFRTSDRTRCDHSTMYEGHVCLDASPGRATRDFFQASGRDLRCLLTRCCDFRCGSTDAFCALATGLPGDGNLFVLPGPPLVV